MPHVRPVLRKQIALDALADEFHALRPTLLGAAYRLTGVRADAEDAVQEAWLRLSEMDAGKRAEINDLTAWLTTVVGRICLDRLRSAAHRRESYVGQWLPEPFVTDLDTPLDTVVRGEDLRLAALVVLDRLTPEQRVAFVLHDAFAVPFAEIADVLGCSVAAARQHASRGRRAVADADIPPPAPLAEQQAVLERFTVALLSGDIDGMTKLLHPDVVLIGDSNGKAKTAAQIIAGTDKVARFVVGIVKRYDPAALAAVTPKLLNGELAFFAPGSPPTNGYHALDARLQLVTVREGRVWAIYDHCNPEKLRAAGLL